MKIIGKTVSELKNNFKWFKQFNQIKKSTINNIEKFNEFKPNFFDKTLILVPHADDEWIGTSQIIKNNENVDIYYFEFLGSNNLDTNKDIRNLELSNICKKFNITCFTKEYNKSHYESLDTLLSNNNYDAIFIPTFIDWHTEHIEVNFIINKVLKDNKQLKEGYFNKIYFYQVSVPLNNLFRLFYYSMNKEQLKFKRHVFNQFYNSQKNLPIKRFNYQDKVNSKYVYGVFSAEVYGTIKLEVWDLMLERIKSKELNFQKKLLKDINDINLIRIIANKIK